MPERARRKTRLQDALARDDLLAKAREALHLGPLCDHCLGRLVAQIDTGLDNAARGQALRRALAGPPPPETCSLCDNLFDAIPTWVVRAEKALEGWEFRTLAVASHADPRIAAREAALWDRVGGDLAEPFKQAFNRLLGIALCNAVGCETLLTRPDVLVVADHASGEVALRVEPLRAAGRYRKLVRGIPQCRWQGWPTSVQQIIGNPVCRAAGGEDHLFHGCGREDTDVRCLGERPFVVEVVRPRRRSLDWQALAAAINGTGSVEVLDLAPCQRSNVARLKGLRPEKTYRALVRLAEAVPPAALERLGGLVGEVEQQTPVRVLRRRADLPRRRRIHSVEWRRTDDRTLELTVRTQAGTYVKELISGDGGRTRPSVAGILGVAAECAELDVVAIHLDG